MKENNTSCEENCVYFQALPHNDKRLNRSARQVTRKGEEFPGSPGSMCGTCTAMKKINTALGDQEE